VEQQNMKECSSSKKSMFGVHSKMFFSLLSRRHKFLRGMQTDTKLSGKRGKMLQTIEK
jgi:hypothetical protein